MMRIDWGAPKISMGELEIYLSSYLGEQYDGLRFEDNYLYIITYTPLNEEQEIAIREYIYNIEETPKLVNSLESPFKTKTLPNGQQIFRRVHGVSASVSGTADNIDFVIPYNVCKITGVEILNGDFGDKANFKVFDTPTGAISGYPDVLLNQFGFDVYINQGYHKSESNYDADLIKDLKLRIEYDAVTSDLLPKTVYINFFLHEVKD